MAPKKTQAVDRAADRIAEECLAVRVRMLNRTITAIYDQALRPLGLTAGQLNILVIIARRSPIAPGGIARRLNMEKSTVSRNIQRMRKNGWLTVTPTESGHTQELALSRQGQALLEKSLPAWKSAQDQTRTLLGPRGTDSIHRTGNTVWSRMETG
jgi:DNA-binding MarR family transcriptional regulator